jgi:hypothetical protein
MQSCKELEGALPSDPARDGGSDGGGGPEGGGEGTEDQVKR